MNGIKKTNSMVTVKMIGNDLLEVKASASTPILPVPAAASASAHNSLPNLATLKFKETPNVVPVFKGTFPRTVFPSAHRTGWSGGTKTTRALSLHEFNALIKEAGASSDVLRMERHFAKLKEAHLTPNFETFESMLRYYIQSNMVDSAMRVYHDLQQGGFQPTMNVFRLLLKGCATTGDLDRTFALVKDMRSHG